MTRVAVVGELTVDDVVYEDEGAVWKQVGGGALYSAIGAVTWDAEVDLHATVGPDYPLDALERVADAGICLGAITRIDDPSLGLWLLYEADGRRHQVPKRRGSSFAQLAAARPPWGTHRPDVHGVHVAPTVVAGQRIALDDATRLSVPATQDALIEPFVDVAAYRSGEALRGAEAFLPSEQEVQQIWGSVDLAELAQQLQTDAGVHCLVVTRGSEGVELVWDGHRMHVPAVTCKTVDQTGAGDAFAGGFLVGWVQTRDPVEAAIRGSVSASFIVETVGAPAAVEHFDRGLAEARAVRLREEVQQLHDG